MNPLHRLIGGILLVSGTTIGAGMLALPIATGFAGFWPACALLIGFWVYMTFTAFLTLEVNLWTGEHSNLMSMAKQTLGTTGKTLSWMIYLFLLYALTTAYLAGGGPILLDVLTTITGWHAPSWITPFPLLILFGFFVYQGVHSVDYANRVLMGGLAVSYLLIVFFLTPHVDAHFLEHTNWSALWIGFSIVSISFGFHIIIPSLTDYLKRDVKQICRVLIIGSLIPLIVYLIWEFLALGILPLYGKSGLMTGYQKGVDGATLLGNYLQSSQLSFLVRLFSLFAILTSFLGVSLSLRDFLADGLRIQKTQRGRLALYLLTFMPPLLITLTDPRAFLNALEYAGAFGVVTLLGLFPVLMVWRGRYHQKREGVFRTPGGKWALIIAFFISIGVIGLEIANRTGILTMGSL